jgi:hypothetical protein
MLLTFGGLDHERVLASLRLLGEAVLPALREIDPPPLV